MKFGMKTRLQTGALEIARCDDRRLRKLNTWRSENRYRGKVMTKTKSFESTNPAELETLFWKCAIKASRWFALVCLISILCAFNLHSVCAEELSHVWKASWITSPDAPLSDCLDCQGWVDGKAENDGAVFRFPTTSATAADWLSSSVACARSVVGPRELWR